MAAKRDEQRAQDPAPSLPPEALEFVRGALADVIEAAREVFVIVSETDVDLTERLLVLLEGRLRATIPDLLVTVRSNPSGRHIESIAPGVVFYERDCARAPATADASNGSGTVHVDLGPPGEAEAQ